jgi:hypothetical protein
MSNKHLTNALSTLLKCLINILQMFYKHLKNFLTAYKFLMNILQLSYEQLTNIS